MAGRAARGRLRRRAIAKARAFVDERLNGKDGLGAIFPAMVNAYEALGLLLSKAGGPDFPDTLAAALGRLAPFDYTVTFAYSGPGKPVCLHHTFAPKQFDIHVRDYEIGPYLLDPFYKATANGTRSGLHRLAELAPDQMAWQAAAAIGWLLAFAPWVLRSLAIYLTPRADGRPG